MASPVPNIIEVTVDVTTRPADVLDQIAKTFSEAADSLRNTSRRAIRNFDTEDFWASRAAE